ncbi:MAG: XTP/dITP diphosphatase [Dehalococcoidia bacterium]|nr:MAG: XTP/dITP diphosphatase [Dehalococcoidia bacterium]
MIRPKLLLATNNRGKLEELRQLLGSVSFDLTSPAQAGLALNVDESGRTYAANARLKARAFARVSGLLTVADDSGLEVDALGGAPGVLSSRYAGPDASDSQRVAFLLSKLEGIPREKRAARFRCVMAIALPNGEVRMCSGSCRGIIAFAPKGNNGFGYDPIFYFPALEKTMAELPSEIKNRISHRAKAAARARIILLELRK